LEVRRQASEGRRKRLTERIAQLGEETVGLEAQRDAKAKEIELVAKERADLEGLAQKKLVERARLTALDRDKVRLEGEHGLLIARIAETKGKISEAELEILGVDEEFRAAVLEELRRAEGEAPQIEEKLTAARDQLARIEIRAPIDGAVHQSIAHTIGGVLQAGETIMSIVPADDRLQVEARVLPQDIDQIRVGQPARLQFSAFSTRTTPTLFGTVRRVSAEITEDERTGMAFYTVRIEPDAGELDKLNDQPLVAGMPVEVFITTGERSAFSWLVKPLTDSMGRALREE
jgi:HlyD family secretion protein